MKKENWEYITTNWGSEDATVMEEIAKIKDTDALELQALQNELEETKKTVQSLTQQNVNLNRTNMDLILRLTDPLTSDKAQEEETEYQAPALDDYDAFVKL